MGGLDEGPRYMPPEPMPQGGSAGAGREMAEGGRSKSPRPVCRLEDPPRPVPMGVRLSALVGGAMTQFGWAFFGFGLIFFWVFFPAAELVSLMEFRGERETAPGTVVRCEETNCEENETRVYAVHYAFTASDGVERQGVSYATGTPVAAGETVTVEYPKGKPSASRIQGFRRSMFSVWASFLAIFPLVGLVFIVVGLKRGIKANRLLAHGKLGHGTLKDKKPTSVTVNDQRVWKLVFEFRADDGRTYETTVKTHETRLLEDDAEERLLYDPWDPNYATMLDNLPGSPAIDEAGHLKSASPLRSLAVAILPTVTILGHGLYVYYRFLQ
ncbi:MAG TPA: DUF3592 domain-containing protein [Phycisphaerae bacterium]|nr:DUF3592 domain-containing protein [Phycisphaerae bacterium]